MFEFGHPKSCRLWFLCIRFVFGKFGNESIDYHWVWVQFGWAN